MVILYRKAVFWIDWCFRNVITKRKSIYFASHLKDIYDCKQKISKGIFQEYKKITNRIDFDTDDFIKDTIDSYLLKILEPQTRNILKGDKELTEKWTNKTLDKLHFVHLSEELNITNNHFIKSMEIIENALMTNEDCIMMNSNDADYYPEMFKDWLDNVGYESFLENLRLKLLSKPYLFKTESVDKAINHSIDFFKKVI